MTTRTLTDHIVPGSATDQLKIEVWDAPGSGGACHAYLISGMNLRANPSVPPGAVADDADSVAIIFQNGPIGETKEMNGVTIETLIAIAIDRLRGFQGMPPVHTKPMSQVVAGPTPAPCRENAISLTHLEEALMWLQKRTRDRQARGVEGTHAR
jgi:hypothetical protein